MWLNIVIFGLTVTKFRTDVVQVNPNTLNSAWDWVLAIQCDQTGGRNLQPALKLAYDDKVPSRHGLHGIYLVNPTLIISNPTLIIFNPTLIVSNSTVIVSYSTLILSSVGYFWSPGPTA